MRHDPGLCTDICALSSQALAIKVQTPRCAQRALCRSKNDLRAPGPVSMPHEAAMDADL